MTQASRLRIRNRAQARRLRHIEGRVRNPSYVVSADLGEEVDLGVSDDAGFLDLFPEFLRLQPALCVLQVVEAREHGDLRRIIPVVVNVPFCFADGGTFFGSLVEDAFPGRKVLDLMTDEGVGHWREVIS